MSEFDIHEHRRKRNQELERDNEYLAAEVERLYGLLSALLLMASRTVGCSPALVLDAACELTDTNPAVAAVWE